MTFAFIKNSDHQPDTSLTMLVVAFIFLLLKMAPTGIDITVGTWHFNGGPIDPFAGVFAGVIAPLAALYWGRRHTDISNNAVQALPERELEPPTQSTTPPPTAIAVAEVKVP